MHKRIVFKCSIFEAFIFNLVNLVGCCELVKYLKLCKSFNCDRFCCCFILFYLIFHLNAYIFYELLAIFNCLLLKRSFFLHFVYFILVLVLYKYYRYCNLDWSAVPVTENFLSVRTSHIRKKNLQWLYLLELFSLVRTQVYFSPSALLESKKNVDAWAWEVSLWLLSLATLI